MVAEDGKINLHDGDECQDECDQENFASVPKVTHYPKSSFTRDKPEISEQQVG